MTDLSKRTTPESDAEALRCSGNTDDDDEGQWLRAKYKAGDTEWKAVVGIRFARSLEQRLGAVTEALEFLLETYEPDEHRSAAVYTYHCPLCYARETLAAIKEAK